MKDSLQVVSSLFIFFSVWGILLNVSEEKYKKVGVWSLVLTLGFLLFSYSNTLKAGEPHALARPHNKLREIAYKIKAKNMPDSLLEDHQKPRGLIKWDNRPGLYEFSPRLKSCHPLLQDFGQYLWNRIEYKVIECKRDFVTQKKNVKKGKSWTMASKHLHDPSLAMDLVVYKGGKVCWDECIPHYYKVASWFMEWSGEKFAKGELKGYRTEPGITWLQFDAVHFELRPL